jgi:heat shock protein HslJ
VRRRKRRIGRYAFSAAAAVCILGWIVACSPEPDGSAPAGLANTAWTVTTINGGGVIADAPPTIRFSADGRISGTTGCNQYSALFSTDGNRITIGALSATEIGCAGARSTQEQVFLKGLDGAATWRMTEGGALEIDGQVALVAGPGIATSPPPPTLGAGLGGTAWNLVELGNTADFAHIVPTIEFGADGSVAGFAGCNTFTGSYTINGSTLALGPLATTKIGCVRPASAVESDYLAALTGVTSWEIGADGRLALGGAVRLRFATR